MLQPDYMAFSEAIINNVKEKSAFRCCRCQNIGIEAHHIIPQKEQGEDTFDNAAPLCPNCHTWFGANPEKRREITQMRDWWYKKVAAMYAQKDVDFDLLKELNSKVEALSLNQAQGLIDLKSMLKKVTNNVIDQVTAGTAVSTASGLASAVSVSPSPSPSPEYIEDQDNPMFCPYCINENVKVGEKCPYCGNVFNGY